MVVLFDVLEHIPDTQPFLSSVIRHQLNGFLLINVPALQTLYSKYDETVGHVRRYNKKTLLAEFSRFNIEVQDLCYWGMTMVPVLALRKLVLRCYRIGKSVEWSHAGLSHPIRSCIAFCALPCI